MNYADDIERQYVDDPGMEYAQWHHEVTALGPRRGGRVEVSRNMRTLVGGFVRFGGTEAQVRAVARFKAVWERVEGGNLRAQDFGQPYVDGGRNDPEASVGNKTDAEAACRAIRKELGEDDTERLVMVAVAGYSPTAYAKWRWAKLSKPNTHYISAGMSEVRGIADRVAVLLKLQGRVA